MKMEMEMEMDLHGQTLPKGQLQVAALASEMVNGMSPVASC